MTIKFKDFVRINFHVSAEHIEDVIERVNNDEANDEELDEYSDWKDWWNQAIKEGDY